MSLLALQRDFRGWLTDDTALPAKWPGVSIYQNTYRAQLVACLSDTFERVLLWLGEDAFLTAAATHIQRDPPSSWTLDAYGTGFPETLASLYPEDPEIAELAWLDLAIALAFVGADAARISAEALGDIDWDSAMLGLSPTLKTRPIGTNTPAIWSAISAGAQPLAAEALAEPATLIVWRQDYVSCFREIDTIETEALALAANGASFGAICAALVDRCGEADGIARAGAILGQWIRDGILVSSTTVSPAE